MPESPFGLTDEGFEGYRGITLADAVRYRNIERVDLSDACLLYTSLDPLSPAEQLLKTFKAAQSRIPKRIFLARWYPPLDAPNDAHHRANLRLQQLRQTLTNLQQQHGIGLELIDMGTEEGGTFPIHSRMYEAIASSDIIICDLTGHRPNVYVEAGFALKHHESNRLIFLFEPNSEEDTVPFDLNTYKYLQVNQAAEIPNRLMPELEAILQDSGALTLR